jgi:XTP/dITP diphosphohydrolase
MHKLLIATTNPGKLLEIKRFFSDLPINLIGLSEITIKDKPVESGSSFEENAKIKALFYAKKTGLPTIGDDGGFEIDALNGQPGIYSHRWIHKDREDDDEELISYTFQKMKNISHTKRGAQLSVCIAFATPGGEVYTSIGVIRGIIPNKPSNIRVLGFPYRSILFIPKINKFYNHDELSEEETEKYNHRKYALEKLKPIIRRTLR